MITDGLLTFIVKFNALTIIGEADFTFIKASCDAGSLSSQSFGSGGADQQPGEKDLKKQYDQRYFLKCFQCLVIKENCKRMFCWLLVITFEARVVELTAWGEWGGAVAA